MKGLLIGLLLLAQSGSGLTIRGRVINDSAMPIPVTGGGGQNNASLGVYLSSNGVVILTTSVRPQGGNFQFRDLRPGKYFVTLEPNDAGLAPIEVVLTDKNVEDLQIRIPSAVLRGTFSVEGGGALPSIRLVLTGSDRGRGSRTYSVSEPTFSFSDIPIGVYSVAIQNLPEGYSVKSVTAGTDNLLTQKLGLTAADPPKVSITLSVSPPRR